jgi:hypothetical protein
MHFFGGKIDDKVLVLVVQGSIQVGVLLFYFVKGWFLHELG